MFISLPYHWPEVSALADAMLRRSPSQTATSNPNNRDGDMKSGCANPLSSEPFLYFRTGKLFIPDVGSSAQTKEASTTGRPRLCGHCAPPTTIVIGQSGTQAVITQPLGEIQFSKDRLLRQSQGGRPIQAVLR